MGAMQLMLRTLLSDRFADDAHGDLELPILALVTAKNDRSLGSQIHLSAVDCGAGCRSGEAVRADRPVRPSLDVREGRGANQGHSRRRRQVSDRRAA